MQLPTFLGIGTPKSGSTWIYDLLQSHPQVWMSSLKAEVHFFNKNFNKGLDWYEQFFPKEIKNKYLQYEEYTPHYIYSREAIQRIAELGVDKLIICCRNPVERAFSHYTFYRRIENYKKTFKEFLIDYPHAIKWGEYANPIKNVLEYFPQESILLLTFEDLFQDIQQTKLTFADFLEIDATKFPEKTGHKKVNESFSPKFGGLYNMGIKTGRLLRKYDLYFLERNIKKSAIASLLSKKGEGYTMTIEDKKVKQELYEHYSKEFDILEKTTTVNVKKWRAMEEALNEKV